MIRKHIIFRGWVQGVGFRWRACQAAELYGCTGWVRNEWDGAVSMEIRCAGLALQTDEMKISFALPAAPFHTGHTDIRIKPCESGRKAERPGLR